MPTNKALAEQLRQLVDICDIVGLGTNQAIYLACLDRAMKFSNGDGRTAEEIVDLARLFSDFVRGAIDRDIVKGVRDLNRAKSDDELISMAHSLAMLTRPPLLDDPQ